MRFFWLVVAVLLLGFPVAPRAADASSSPSYEELLTRLKSGDTSIDFQALRYAYADTPQFSPIGGTANKGAMFRALNAGDLDMALSLANAILEGNFTDIDAHYTRFVVFDKRGDSMNAIFDRAVVRGLLGSIADSGDGKTADTAFVVIAVPEEYSYLGINGYRVERQSLVNTAAGPVDAMDVADQRTGEKQTIYFNVSRSFAALERLFGKNKPKAP